MTETVAHISGHHFFITFVASRVNGPLLILPSLLLSSAVYMRFCGRKSRHDMWCIQGRISASHDMTKSAKTSSVIITSFQIFYFAKFCCSKNIEHRLACYIIIHFFVSEVVYLDFRSTTQKYRIISVVEVK